MSKGSIFVTVCALLIIGSFILSCFLMTTVNPPKLTTDTIMDLRRRMLSDLDDDEIIAGRSENLHDSFAPFYRYAPANWTKSPPMLEKSIYILPYTVKVSPPIDPPWMTPTKVESITKRTQETEYTENNITLLLNMTNSELTPVKGHRRSINNYHSKIIEGYQRSVYLKIIDEDGRPRIEIKLNPDMMSRDHEKIRISSSFKMQGHKNQADEAIDELGYNTEIKILPNDTIVIGSNDELSEKNNDFIIEGFAKENKTEIKSNSLPRLFIPVITDITKFRGIDTNLLNYVPNAIQYKIKSLKKDKVRSENNYFQPQNNQIVKGASSQNKTDITKSNSKSFNIPKSTDKKNDLKNNETKEKTAVHSNLNHIINLDNELKQQLKAKDTNATKTNDLKLGNISKETKHQAEVSQNNNNLRMLFANETKSITETYAVDTVVKHLNTTKSMKKENNLKNNVIIEKSIMDYPFNELKYLKNETNRHLKQKYTNRTKMNDLEFSNITKEPKSFNPRILFANETKSFTESYAVETAVTSLNITIATSQENDLKNNTIKDKSVAVPPYEKHNTAIILNNFKNETDSQLKPKDTNVITTNDLKFENTTKELNRAEENEKNVKLRILFSNKTKSN